MATRVSILVINCPFSSVQLVWAIIKRLNTCGRLWNTFEHMWNPFEHFWTYWNTFEHFWKSFCLISTTLEEQLIGNIWHGELSGCRKWARSTLSSFAPTFWGKWFIFCSFFSPFTNLLVDVFDNQRQYSYIIDILNFVNIKLARIIYWQYSLIWSIQYTAYKKNLMTLYYLI